MAHLALFLLSVVRAIVEIAVLALLGQGAVALLAGLRRDGNPVYQLFTVVTGPVLRLARRVLPRVVIDRHLPLLTFLVLLWLWLLLAWLKHLLAR